MALRKSSFLGLNDFPSVRKPDVVGFSSGFGGRTSGIWKSGPSPCWFADACAAALRDGDVPPVLPDRPGTWPFIASPTVVKGGAREPITDERARTPSLPVIRRAGRHPHEPEPAGRSLRIIPGRASSRVVATLGPWHAASSAGTSENLFRTRRFL